MLEVPDAKRVRREDLYESNSEDESMQDDQLDSTLRGKLNAQLSGLLGLNLEADGDDIAQIPPGSRIKNAADDLVGDDEDAQKSGEEAFTFRLFRNEEPSHKVVLESQDIGTEKAGEGAFVVQKRPISYYLASEPPPELANEFRVASVSADYLLQDAKKRRWGLEKPWKVTTITITTNKKTAAPSGSTSSNGATGIGKQKKRPGKKRRIILRVRQKAKKELEENAKKQLVDKEQHLKEKKQRLNKQKKLKRRAKARELKQSMKGDGASEQNSRDSSPSSK
ncbi:uncharacterized protein GGS22DRAFT_200186 [Annulohypoxylon maeteangense]|uniref:uncharacterized protein n=1 Tax=Annulohypoxylon maeteangense TaxID=1927788 RepID=UPI0020081E56|nr:uncharacterized protein GGS22DRAFT_200186 [Annulohypoxylon maeteangense]KAI0885127.1 hypothetical protein GGS22DRAFT_200186 [Annulohypoxylon maeteangense]